jgi:hypothetical protein
MRVPIFFVAFALASPALAQVHGTSCRATASAFNALQDGMSAQQVEATIGCAGVVMSEGNMAGITTSMVGWDGSGSMGANMNVMFQNGRLIMKSQFGLR